MKFAKDNRSSNVNVWRGWKKDKKLIKHIMFWISEHSETKFSLCIYYNIREMGYNGNLNLIDTVDFFKSDKNNQYFASLKEAIEFSEKWAEINISK